MFSTSLHDDRVLLTLSIFLILLRFLLKCAGNVVRERARENERVQRERERGEREEEEREGRSAVLLSHLFSLACFDLFFFQVQNDYAYVQTVLLPTASSGRGWLVHLSSQEITKSPGDPSTLRSRWSRVRR